MNVLVTDGTGFVGSHLVRRLLAAGNTVTSLDKNRELFHDELERSGATLMFGVGRRRRGSGDGHGRAERGWFVMVGSGNTYNHPVYIENLIDLFELTATAPQAKGRVYLAGDDDFFTLTDLVRKVGDAVGTSVRIVRFPYYGFARLVAATVETVCRPLGVRPPIFRRRLSWFITNRAFRIDRARDELGYRPRVSLFEGLARTAAWYMVPPSPSPSRPATHSTR